MHHEIPNTGYRSFTANNQLSGIWSDPNRLRLSGGNHYQIKVDGLVKISIYVVADLARRFAVPRILSHRHF